MSEEKYFRGRLVYTNKSYPGVYWPDHPEALSDGQVSIHRVIAHEKYDGIPEGCHVHHKDGDPWNWSPENLELMEAGEHSSHHRSAQPVSRSCGNCGDEVVVRTTRKKERDEVYCSHSCSNSARYGVNWPPVETVQVMVEEVGYAQTGRNLGVSDNAVRKFLERKGL